MRIFVSGATGVVGRRLVPELVAAGHRVTAIGRAPEKCAALDRQGALPVDIDLFRPEAVRRAVEGHETVINLATHVPRGWRMMRRGAWRENDRLRRVASAILADAALAAGADRLIQESFAPAYPDCGGRWIDEHTSLSPVRYNETVVDAERAGQIFCDSGRTGVVLRFGAFYGPDAGQTRDMIRWVRRGRGPLPGPAESYFSSISHDDAARAVAAALGVPAGTYNVVDDQPLTHREFVDSLADALGVAHPRLPPLWLTSLMGSLGGLLARSQRISNRKLRSVSPWTPRYSSVREGWPAVIEELRKTGAL